ncbi:MAG: ATP-binding protein [Sideroxydans sp.]|nr:ATP-binding protein [Sideroxydans sp.]
MRKHGIERQTLAAALIPILILSVLLEGYYIYTRIVDLDRALFDRAKLIVHQLATSSEYAVFSGNRSLLQQQVDLAFAQQDVNSVAVLDAAGKFLAGAGNSRNSEAIGQAAASDWNEIPIQEDGNVLTVYQSIVATQIELDDPNLTSPKSMSKPLGGAILVVSKKRLNAEKIQMLVLNLLLTLLILGFAIVVSMRVSRRITVPILGIRTAVRNIGDGRLDTRIDGDTQVHELNELAEGINEMAAQLQQQRDTLQQRIDEATLELRGKKEEAEKANFDKTRFLAAASHDLRQPMHALGLFMGELHNRINTPEQRKLVEKIEESVEAMSGLLDSLLDISKLDAGVVVPQIMPVKIDAMMRRLAQDFAADAQRKNITLSIHSLPAEVISDPVLLERILLNLLSNAIRYTPQNGSVLFACRRRGDDLRIEVRDNGIGIPPEEQQNVFREFVQMANSARDRSKGLGLGLAIVDRLCKLLHHTLTLRSGTNRGSTFAVTVPRVFDVEELLAEPIASGAQTPVSDELKDLRVLVVEDDPLVRASMDGILSSWGCCISLAESLHEVKEKYAQSNFDLVICDYRLPDGNGIELADRLSDLCDTLPPFILISGDTGSEVLQAVNERGYHLLHKPVRPAKLRSMISYVLREQHRPG